MHMVSGSWWQAGRYVLGCELEYAQGAHGARAGVELAVQVRCCFIAVAVAWLLLLHCCCMAVALLLHGCFVLFCFVAWGAQLT